MTITRVELLRHGLPEGDDCFRGHTDFLLTEEGGSQMHKAVAGSDAFDLVVTSPLQRCADFAYRHAEQYCTPVVEESDFIELNFGDWDGRSRDEVWKSDQKTLSQFWSEPWKTTPPNGESLEEFDSRIQAAWSSLLDEYQGKRILLVTHGGVIKQILRLVLDMPKSEGYLQRIKVPYAAKLTITVYHDDNGRQWPELHWPTL
ncbi:histidine phosphatase family protein [Photobacterium sp. SDRW27]|uniref:histidine phosphatase family protein n=1 Tax=Photobacterium obscurum TaxID=2829490 RepID=UPI0022437BAD|nr:histidine phosphatase family protein [Photobacterium obscurum]MCW8329138.1 histidine phosphatase family protein [Photobacterium obscurum]